MDNINDIIKKGNIDDINKMFENGATINDESLDVAIDTEDLQIINIVIEKGAIINDYTFIHIIKTGNINIISMFLKILVGNNTLKMSIDANIIYHALSTENLTIINMFLEAGFYYYNSEEILIYELKYKNVSSLKLILSYHNNPISFSLLKQVISTADIDIISIFIEKTVNIIKKDYADNYDIEHLIKFIHNMNLEKSLSINIYRLIINRFIKIIDVYTFNELIKLNNLDIFKIMLDNDIEPNQESLKCAIKIKNINMIELILLYVKPSSDSLDDSIINKDMNIINFFLDKGVIP